MLLMLRESCQKRAYRRLFMLQKDVSEINIDDLLESTRRSPLQPTSPTNALHSSFVSSSQQTRDACTLPPETHPSMLSTGPHVVLQNIGNPIDFSPTNQVLSSTYYDHLMLGAPAVLGDNNGVDRVATPCEKCQLTRLAIESMAMQL